jgi:adenosylcobinamide-phosphate synthase
MYFQLAFFTYIFDRIFCEFWFVKSYKHPVVFMGEFIKWYEKKFYKDSIARGIWLNLFLVGITFCISFIVDYYINNIILLSLLASPTLASTMLYKSVKDIINNPQNIKYLVSRDTNNLSNSDINKAAIETYSENLSDGVVAPLFYLLCFGIVGAYIYKAINTLDSMVGYRTKKYEKFGKFSAKVDDIANYIPARLTAILIAILFCSKKVLLHFTKYAPLHKSPNAGYPISAIALALDLKLGGDTRYFGKLEHKPYFGDGKKTITQEDIKKALKFQYRFDIFVFVMFIIYIQIQTL